MTASINFNDSNYTSLTERIDIHEAEKQYHISSQVHSPFLDYADEQETRIHRGSLHVSSFILFDDTYNVIIDGDLTVDGVLSCSSDVNGNFLLVTGNVNAAHVDVSEVCTLAIRGNLFAPKGVIGSYGEDGGSIDIRGRVDAPFMIAGLDFRISVGQKPEMPLFIGSQSEIFVPGIGPLNGNNPALLLRPELVDKKGRCDILAIQRAVLAGADIFCPETADLSNQEPTEEIASDGRPANVPAKARWMQHDHEWELGERDIDNKPIGEWKWWLAPTGHLCCHTCYRGDVDGTSTYTRYHPDGTPSRQGTYAKGAPVGEQVWMRSDNPTEEYFPSSAQTPEGTWKIVQQYENGRCTSNQHFDKQGNCLDLAAPPRPSTVPVHAQWDENNKSWVIQQSDAQNKPTGDWHYWTSEGFRYKIIQHKPETRMEIQFHPDGTPAILEEFLGTFPLKHGKCLIARCESATNCSFPDDTPPNTWKIYEEYRAGEVAARTFFDKDDNEVGAPKRPEGVPENAIWNHITQSWLIILRDESGEMLEWLTWTPIGHLLRHTTFGKSDHNQETTHVETYHPDGGLYVQFEYRTAWKIKDGTCIWQRSKGEGAHPFPHLDFPIVTDAVWKIIQVYKDDTLKSEVFLDSDGQELDHDAIIAAGKAEQKAAAKAHKAKKKAKKHEPAPESTMALWPAGTIGHVVPQIDAAAMLLSGEYFDKLKLNYKNIISDAAGCDLPALVIEGDVHVTGDLLDEESYAGLADEYCLIIVNGNLTVDGTLRLGWGERIYTPFVVLGDLQARNVVASELSVLIEGNMTLDGLLLFLWEGDISINGKLATKLGYYGRDNYIEADGNKSPKGVLHASDFLDEYISIDDDDPESGVQYGIDYDMIESHKIIEALYTGKPVTKP